MKKSSIVLLILLLAVSASVSADQITTVQRPTGIPSFVGYVPDRFIVVMKPDVGKLNMQMAANAVVHIGDPDFDRISDRFAVSSIKKQFVNSQGELARYHKIKFESGTLEEAMEAYRNHPMVDHVEPIGIHTMYATPSDFYYSYQWHLNQAGDHDIDAPEAWDIEVGSDATVVAILDSGTRYYHPDLGGVNASPSNPGASRGNMWINNPELNGSSGVDDDGNGYVDDWIGYDFIQSTTNCWSGEDCNTQDNDPRDFNGHGTHTSGIFGMITNDGYGMCGVAGGWGNGSQTEYANGVRIMPLRMGYSYNYLGQEYGVVLMDAAAEAFYYAADNGARIASCSWGSSNSGGIGAAVTYFLNSGGIVFVAAGNDGSQTADYLNGRGDCISVAATDENDNAASFTTYGTWVDICAPGNNIYSTYHDHTDPNTNYWAALSGTSMATPMAAGVGALIWSHNPSWTASQVTNQLYSSADNIDAYLSSQYIGKMGAGRINAYNAVNTGPPPAPVAEFSGSPTSGTEPLTVNFTDLSTGSITSWDWTFGDGGTATQQNPSHQYTSAGTYTVSLTVTGPGGSDGETKNNYITVNPCITPTAGFFGSPTSGDYPLTVDFTDQSSNATSWDWNFGDGGTSTAQNPSHTYTAAGTYTVTQTVTNSCGSDQLVRTDYITVTTPPCDPPVADFVGSPTGGDYPLNVNFTDLSTNSPTSWSWDFGDGGNSSAQNPSHTYTSAGIYTVALTATNSCGSDDESKTGYITVTEPSIDYATVPYSTGFESGSFDQYWFTQSSNSEGRILITTANGPHSGSYHLTMDDNLNGGQYAQNETWLRLNLSGNSQVELSFWWKEFSDEDHTQDGVFFSDNGGSSFTKVYNLTGGSSTYQEIVLDVDQLAGSAGLSLTGTFVIKFQQYDNYGITTDGMAFDDISVVSFDVPPVADFSGTPTSGTAPLQVNFTDQSTNNPTGWNWDFGDGGNSTAQNPSHIYTNPGMYTVTLTASNAYGSDDEIKVDYITVNPCIPPTAAFVGSPTSGDAPLTVDFTDQSTDAPTSWSWDFGDGGNSTAQNPSHTYTSAGIYTVTLTATNSCGSDDEIKTNYITVTEPSADYANLPYSTGFESGSFDQYWLTQSSNSEGRILITTANTPHSGSYHMTMDDNLNGGQYAQNEAWLRLNLAGKSDVELSFWWKEFSDEDHTQDGVFFSDDGGSNFSKIYNLTGGSSSYQEIVLDVDQLAAGAGLSLTGTFVIKFQQYDNYGITTDGMAFDDISVASLEVPPVAEFSGTPTSGTAPLQVDFTDLSTNNPTSWSWDFGDGGNSTAQNPSHTYNAIGTYTVTLTATNAYGSDSEVKTDYITVTESTGYASLPYTTGFEAGALDQYWETYSTGDGRIRILTSNAPHSGSYHMTMDDATNGGYSLNEAWLLVNVSGHANVDLTFWWKEFSDESHSQDGVYFSDNGGSTFTKVYNLTGGNSTYRQIFLDVDQLAASYGLTLSSTFVVKFQQYDNYPLTTDGMAFDDISVTGSGAAKLADGQSGIPDKYSLSQNYPNPFNPTTEISFALPSAGHVSLEVYNVLGQRVVTLVDEYCEAGEHVVQWNSTDASGNHVSSGVYIYRLVAGQFIETKKMILLK